METLVEESSRTFGADRHAEIAAVSKFRLGIFGDTRSGKTMYLTALYASSQDGTLPAETNLRTSPGSSLKHLNSRLAMIRTGQWPPGDLDREPIELLVDYRKRTFGLRTRDFKGGDFGDITEPESRAEFERFIGELFEGCSAYVFLIDPGVIKDADSKTSDARADIMDAEAGRDEEYLRHREALRVTSAVNMALERLRGSGKVSHLMHRPVAIVFTKGDLHPEVMDDPAGFARRHMESTCRYLGDHAPHRHRYFAVSSTGPLPESGSETSPPPYPLKPMGLISPLLWCIDQHMTRHRLLRRLVMATGFVLLAACYAALYSNNAHRLHTIEQEIRYSDDQRLPELSREADALTRSVLIMPTHPFAAERVRQAVVAEARRRLQDDIDKRIDSQGNLREVSDYQDISPRIEAFANNYPGTADAQDMQVWLKGQRESLSRRVADELERLAKDGKELAFDDKQSQYALVATAEMDDRTAESRRILNRSVFRRKISLLFDVRLSKPRDVAEVRRVCAEAEKEIEDRHLPDSDPQVRYVRAVRGLYDSLAAQGINRQLHFRIDAPTKTKLQWYLNQNDWDDANRLARSAKWETPVANPDEAGWYMIVGQPFTIDLLDAKSLLFWLKEDTWWTKEIGQISVQIDKLDFGRGSKFSTSTGIDFYVTFFDDRGEVRQFYKDMNDLVRLEDELFGRQRPTDALPEKPASAVCDPVLQPLIVCTNSWRDYAITVRRGDVNGTIASYVLKDLLPAFARILSNPDNAFRMAVGAVEFGHEILVYRVFDIGVYRGRPHTVGLVALLLPTDPRRGWLLSNVLSRLSPPRPGSDNYALPTLDPNPEPCTLEPFVALDRWEAAHDRAPADRAKCFCSPQEIEVDLPTLQRFSPRRSLRPNRAWIAGIFAIALASAAVAALARWHEVGPPPQPHSEKPLLDDGASRDRLAQVLMRCYFIDDFRTKTLSNSELRSLAVAAAARAKANSAALGAAIGPMEAMNRPADIAAVIKVHLSQWERPGAIAPSTIPRSDAEAQRALVDLERYDHLFNEARGAIESPSESAIRQLLGELQGER